MGAGDERPEDRPGEEHSVKARPVGGGGGGMVGTRVGPMGGGGWSEGERIAGGLMLNGAGVVAASSEVGSRGGGRRAVPGAVAARVVSARGASFDGEAGTSDEASFRVDGGAVEARGESCEIGES